MKKEYQKEEIIKSYMDYKVDRQLSAINLKDFLEACNISKKTFKTSFIDIQDTENQIYKSFLNQTITLLSDNEDYISYDAKDKLLSFYFTFFELLSLNRDFVKLSLKTLGFSELKLLKRLKKSFIKYIKILNIDSFDLKHQSLNKTKNVITQEAAWLQLIFTLRFWLTDSSKDFEKTDVFIEKSINTTFELINTTPLESLIDLGKFLYNEKLNTKK